MRTGFKMATAGLALVLGCASCALSPIDAPVSDAVSPAAAVAQDARASQPESSELADQPQLLAGAALAAVDAGTSDVHRSAGEADAQAASNMHIAAQGVQYRDGVYRASAQGWQGSVPVTVTVSHGKVESIVVGQNSEAAAMVAKAQETVVPQIIETQSTADIDLATGATHSSRAIVEAVGQALELALVG